MDKRTIDNDVRNVTRDNVVLDVNDVDIPDVVNDVNCDVDCDVDCDVVPHVDIRDVNNDVNNDVDDVDFRNVLPYVDIPDVVDDVDNKVDFVVDCDVDCDVPDDDPHVVPDVGHDVVPDVGHDVDCDVNNDVNDVDFCDVVPHINIVTLTLSATLSRRRLRYRRCPQLRRRRADADGGDAARAGRGRHLCDASRSTRGEAPENMNVTPPRQKRSYVRITNQQRNDLIIAFREFGDDKPPEWYSCKFGITLHNVANLLVKLRRGESIMPKGYYNRKSRVVPFQHLVRREIELDATVPMWQVRKDLEAVVARYGSDVESLAPDVVDDIVRARNERGQIVGGGDVHADDSHGTADTDDIDTLNDTLNGTDDVDMLDDDTHSRPAVQIPSVSSLNAFLRGDSGMDILRDIPVFTMKRETVRGAHANTPENKELRYQAIVELQGRMMSGYTWVCLDETN